MIFKLYNRYMSLIFIAILIAMSFSLGTIIVQTIFSVIGVILVFVCFGEFYKIENNTLSRYFFGFKISSVDIAAIREIQLVKIKKPGYTYVYIGKTANETKEDGYYLILNDQKIYKVNSDYRNDEGKTVGKYLIEKNRIKSKHIEKFKFFNDHFR